MKGNFEFPSPQWDNISSLAKDLISKCLEKDAKKRYKASDVLSHPWMVGDVTPRTILPITDKYKAYHLTKKVKKVSTFVMAANKWANILKPKK